MQTDTLLIAYDLLNSLQISAQDPELVEKAKRIAAAREDLESELKKRQEDEYGA